MRFIHCSDVHVTGRYFGTPLRTLGWRRVLALLELGPGGRGRAYRDAAESLARIAGDVVARRADHLILSGDVTAYALESEFQGARTALGPLSADPRRCTV